MPRRCPPWITDVNYSSQYPLLLISGPALRLRLNPPFTLTSQYAASLASAIALHTPPEALSKRKTGHSPLLPSCMLVQRTQEGKNISVPL